MDIESYFRAAADKPPSKYLGQLSDEFQRALRSHFGNVRVEDCLFYHTLELPDGAIHEGLWDLRGRESNYLGGFDFRGRRILELGPASGHLTFWMERQGASVVALDLPLFVPQPVLPEPGADLFAADASAVDDLRPVRNSWWFAHNRFSSGAKCVYADIYDLPSDLGRFDVAVFGSILLHLSRPFDALREAAKVTEEAIIVSEPVPDIPLSRRPLASFDPSGRPYVFWGLSPPALAGMLRRLGFPYLSATSHWQHRVDAAQKEKAYFTIVARRGGPVGRNYEGPSLREIIKSRVGRLISMMRRSIRSR